MRTRKGIGIGSVSLILIFSVLCLSVFALLSLSTAKRDMELSRRLQDSAENYYSADTRAEIIRAGLYKALSSGDQPESVEDAQITYVQDSGLLYVSYLCEIDDRRAISALLCYDGEGLSTLEWKETQTSDWNPSESIQVWQG